MRKVLAALFALALCSCQGQPQGGKVSGVPVEGDPGTVPRPESGRVALGDPADVAHQQMLQSGGREGVGIGFLYLGPGDLRWYDLRDGTCVAVRTEATEGKGAKVTRIVSGEPGRGYGDKKEWHNHSREVDFIELR